MPDDQPQVTLYTDGAAEPNPGSGGYGVVLLFGQHRKELSAGYQLTTNNRMELLAVIVGLEALKKPCDVVVYSDSRYVVDAVEKGFVFRWRDLNWWRTKKEKAKNADLWQRFLVAYESHSVSFQWVPGHQGIEENERCDQLAVEAAKSQDRLPDDGYEPSAEAPAARSPAHGQSKTTHTEPGEPCRKCGTPLVKKVPKQKKQKPGQSYYYEWYLSCSGCKAMYMVEAAKREYDNAASLFD